MGVSTENDHQTIIECLKYATIGDLPPNSKGGAFIHDPKVNRTIRAPPDRAEQILDMQRERGARTGQNVVQRHQRSQDGRHPKCAAYGEKSHQSAKDARVSAVVDQRW